MKETVRHHYFVVGKLISLVLFMGYEIMNYKGAVMEKAWLGLLIAFFLVASVLLEITESRRAGIIEIIMEGILAVVAVFLFPVSGCILGIVVISDLCALLQASGGAYLLSLVMLIPYYRMAPDMLPGVLVAIIIVVAYFQEKIIVAGYLSAIGIEEETQQELKTEMKKSHLKFENQMLADRNRISQALHDKLGHSINGSIYQLEAAKLLVEKKPQECEHILQIVIDQLRLSMDEIRAILRSERPDKKRVAQLALQSLCEECQEQYDIHTELNIQDENGGIPDKIWEIILDNTYEAVTNALKYANCHSISIDIIAMNEIVRCTIRDDGKGAADIEEGMGIAGMKNRVRAIKGYIDIESEAGFTINMILPIQEKRG